MNHDASGSPQDAARVLLFSTRNIARHVSRCGGYEFEDVICSCDSTDIVAPFAPRHAENRIAQSVRRILRRDRQLIGREVRINKDYDLFFAFCLNPHDLGYLQRVKGLHDRCRRSVCVIGELWPSRMSEFCEELQVLRRFDRIFSNLQSSVDLIKASTGRPCQFLPVGVDALRFCPFPNNPERNIDVYNMGRRVEEEHRALVACAERGELFYVYDTTRDFDVIDPRDHRTLLANLIKRSRYFVTRPAKFDTLAETGGEQEMGSRFFEGAAGGAVMIGMSPGCPAYDDCFDWPDAVLPVDGEGEQIAAQIMELDAQPHRIVQIRRNNIVNSLQRHDWVYRWHRILESVDLPATVRLIEREESLKSVADAVACDGRRAVLEKSVQLHLA